MVAGLTRRALLARGAAGLVLAGCGQTVQGRPARTAAQADVALLTRALEDESRSAATYARLRSPGAPPDLVPRLRAAEDRHVTALYDAIARLGGGEPEIGFFAYEGEGLQEALELEEGSAARYIALLPRVRTPEVRTTLAFILAEEAAHAAALRDALGRDPVTGAFL